MSKSVVTADFSTGHMMGGDDEEDENKVMKSSQAGKSSSSCKVVVRCCQVDKCGADLAVAKQYHTRHKVCEVHAKAQSVLVDGMRQRFCQQCSRFHEVLEFDESKRSCRRRLAGHNERRRRRKSDPNQAKAGMVCGGFNYSLPEKHFHIR